MVPTFDRPDPRDGTADAVVGRRIGAFVVDQLLVLGVLVTLASSVLGVAGGVLGASAEFALVEDPLRALLGGTSLETAVAVGAAVFGLVATLATVAYFTVAEGTFGRTAGKALFGLVVVRTDGTPVGYRGALVRTLARVVDRFPGLYLLGFASMLASDRRQRVGDRLAGTVVVAAESTPRGESATAGRPA